MIRLRSFSAIIRESCCNLNGSAAIHYYHFNIKGVSGWKKDPWMIAGLS